MVVVVDDDEHVQFSVHLPFCSGQFNVWILNSNCANKTIKGYEHPEKTDQFWLSYPPTILGRSCLDPALTFFFFFFFFFFF